MKKTHKKLLGFFGLVTVAVMTAVAVALPNPGVSALSNVTDTIVIRVIGDNPEVVIDGVESGTVSINPEKNLTISYENVENVRVVLVYTDLNGVEQTFDLADEFVDYAAGSFALNLDLSEPQYGYGDYILRATGDGASGPDEDIIQFSYTPFIAELDDNEETGKAYVDLDYTESEEGSDEDKIGEFKIEVFDEDGNLVTPLSPITALPPEKQVELPFDKYDLPSGTYTIKITAYNLNGDELTVRYLTKDIEGEEVIPVPDTGKLSSNSSVSTVDFLITGMLIFLMTGIGGIVFITRRDSRKK